MRPAQKGPAQKGPAQKARGYEFRRPRADPRICPACSREIGATGVPPFGYNRDAARKCFAVASDVSVVLSWKRLLGRGDCVAVSIDARDGSSQQFRIRRADIVSGMRLALQDCPEEIRKTQWQV